MLHLSFWAVCCGCHELISSKPWSEKKRHQLCTHAGFYNAMSCMTVSWYVVWWLESYNWMRRGLFAAFFLFPKVIMISHPLAFFFFYLASCFWEKQLDRFHSFSGRDTPEHLANGGTVPTLIRSGLETAVLKGWLRGTGAWKQRGSAADSSFRIVRSFKWVSQRTFQQFC